MEKYYLPISINNKRSHVCHLTNKANNKDFHFFEFVINNTGNVSELINIKEDTCFINDQGRNSDVKINNTGIKGEIDVEKGSIELTFTKGEYTASNKNIAEKNGIYIRKEQSGSIIIAINPNYNENKLDIKLILNIGEEEKYFYTSVFHIVNSNDTLIEAGIDFGSESSQMAYRNVSENDKIFPVINIIKNLKTFYESGENDKDYYQYEKPEDNIPLFKSFFTVYTEKINDLRIYLKPNHFNKKTFINALLTKETANLEEENLKLLPNLKYLQIQSGSYSDDTTVNHIDAKQNINGTAEWLTPDGISVSSEKIMLSKYNNYYKRYILNYFLHALFKAITQNHQKAYVKLKLLIPNVYNQIKIYEIIHNIYKDFNSIINEYGNEYSIKGIEVETISESDAAFLGLLYNNEIMDKNDKVKLSANKLYLLIDGGKGTLDFTILKSGDTNYKFNSIYRGGIPGSGQILNYAIMQLFNDGLKSYNINLEKIVETFNSYGKNEFLKAIEKVKQNCEFIENDNNLLVKIDDKYIEGDEGINARIIKIQGHNEENAIVKLLNIFSENHLMIPDINNRLGFAIDTLCGAIENKIKDFQNIQETEGTDTKLFYQIVLSGRAFRFKEFENKMRDFLSKFSDIITYPNSKAKTACIEGVIGSANYEINLNSLLIGFPNIINETDSIRKIVNNDVLINTKKHRQDDPFDLFTLIKSLFAKINKDTVEKDSKLETKIDENLITHGINISPNGYNNLLLSLPGEEFRLSSLNEGEIANLFFNEKEFVFRTNEKALDIGESEYIRHSGRLMDFSNYPIINTNVNLSNDLFDKEVAMEEVTDNRIKGFSKNNWENPNLDNYLDNNDEKKIDNEFSNKSNKINLKKRSGEKIAGDFDEHESLKNKAVGNEKPGKQNVI